MVPVKPKSSPAVAAAEDDHKNIPDKTPCDGSKPNGSPCGRPADPSYGPLCTRCAEAALKRDQLAAETCEREATVAAVADAKRAAAIEAAAKKAALDASSRAKAIVVSSPPRRSAPAASKLRSPEGRIPHPAVVAVAPEVWSVVVRAPPAPSAAQFGAARAPTLAWLPVPVLPGYDVRRQVGRIIGSGGSAVKDIEARTGCRVVVLDKNGPLPWVMVSAPAAGCSADEFEAAVNWVAERAVPPGVAPSTASAACPVTKGHRHADMPPEAAAAERREKGEGEGGGGAQGGCGGRYRFAGTWFSDTCSETGSDSSAFSDASTRSSARSWSSANSTSSTASASSSTAAAFERSAMPIAMRCADTEDAAALSASRFNEHFNSLPVAVAVPARTETSPVAAATNALPVARAAPLPVVDATAPRTSSAATAASVMAPAVTTITTTTRLEEALRSNDINSATLALLSAAGLLTSAFLYTATDAAMQDAGIKTGPRLKVAAFRDAAACEWLPAAPAEDPALAALLCSFGLGAYRAALAEEDFDRAAFALSGETEAARFNIKASDRDAFRAAVASVK
jgi:hypothetical protein